MIIPKPKWYANEFKKQRPDELIANAVVMEAYWSNKSNGLTNEEIIELLKTAKKITFTDEEINKAESNSIQIVRHKGKIVTKTMLRSSEYYLAIK